MTVTSVLELNPEQSAAIEHGQGPLLIIAGPGSGKTRVITERIVHLLGRREASGSNTSGAVGPESILALTYTEKAAGEMSHRVRQALPDLETHPTITTFHAFCLDVLKRRHFDQQLLDEIDLWIFLRWRLRALALEHYLKLAEPGAFLHDLNDFFSRCQDELVEPDDFAVYVAKCRDEFAGRTPDPMEIAELAKKEELVRVFRRSRELLEQAGCTSFGSLMSKMLRLWDEEPPVLERLRQRFRYVLVDEYQDTNYAQVEILRRLVTAPYNITAVGDDDQAIYRFRGASSGAFQMFDHAFPGHATVYLSRNYRSLRRILRASQVVIEKNAGRYESKPPLRTGNPEGERVFLLESPDAKAEAVWVAEEIERLRKRGRRLGEVAVLYRSHAHRERLVEQFRLRGIDFNIRGLTILRTPLVRSLLAYLRLIHSLHDNISLTRVLLAPRWRFPEALAQDARRRASQNRSSIYTAVRATAQTLFAADLRRTGWYELDALLARLREIARVSPVPALFDRLVTALGIEIPDHSREAGYLKAFRQFLEAWQEKHARGGLAPVERDPDAAAPRPIDSFMDYFSLFLDAGGQIEAPEPRDTANAVQMMTVHAAKGLEFPAVFVLSVSRNRFPTNEKKPVIEFPDVLRKDPAAPAGIHQQEERRLFYVAMTRARERLYVSSIAAPGQKPSLFIRDLLSNPAVTARDLERIKVPALPEPEKPAGAGAEPATTSRVLLSERALEGHGTRKNAGGVGNGQGLLFPEMDAGDESLSLHPDLEAWARQPVASGAESNHPLVLSATAVETYLNCPLRFKLRNLLKIQAEPQAALTFGSVMHESVRHYFELRRSGMPRFEDVEQFFLHAWKDVGFEDPYHAERSKQEGLDQLRRFVEHQNAVTAPADVVSEQGFAFDLDDVRVQGRIDQIQTRAVSDAGVAPYGRLTKSVPNTGAATGGRPYVERLELRSPSADTQTGPFPRGTEVELIDYKTGRPKSQKDADSSLQLSVYALAAERTMGLRPTKLTFYNLGNNEAVSGARTSKALADVVKEIREVASAIRAGEFQPSPGFICRRCDFTALCPTQEES
ncbi:MAG TPA: ATP-dependent DNA helicase [Terriglobia bacterium]|nr:ATP-dependent DNA helicase [Terriglobia bacterium]